MLTVENAAAEAARFIETIPPYPGGYEGRGIVTCAGGVKYLTCAWVLIKMLRHLGCTLPIEVWYLGDDEGDSEWIELVKPLGVECIDAFAIRDEHPHPRLGGWQCKAYALRHTKFQEALFLDADNVPVRDPTFLFDCSEYRATGAVFWPDGFRTPENSPRWDIFGVAYRDEPEFESGQFLVDKRRCWPAVCLADWYNQHSEFFYQHVYGDKDTFRYAWHRVGMPYQMPATGPGTIPYSLVQYDFQGDPLFQHRIHDKWSLVGNRRSRGFIGEDACLADVAKLKTHWNPQKHLIRHISDVDRQASISLFGKRFIFTRIGYGSHPIELGENGYLTAGWSSTEFYWWRQHGALVIAGVDGHVTGYLSPDKEGDHSFSGQSERRQQVRLQVTPS